MCLYRDSIIPSIMHISTITGDKGRHYRWSVMCTTILYATDGIISCIQFHSSCTFIGTTKRTENFIRTSEMSAMERSTISCNRSTGHYLKVSLCRVSHKHMIKKTQQHSLHKKKTIWLQIFGPFEGQKLFFLKV